MSVQTYAPQNDMPPAVTSGTTLQTFTDPYGELWVAKNGVNGGAWRRPRDVLQARVYRAAAYTCPTSAGTYGWDTVWRDPYGIWVPASLAFILPLTAMWKFSCDISCAANAVNSWYECQIRRNGSTISDDTGYGCTLTAATLFARGAVAVYAAANDQIAVVHQAPGAYPGNPGNLYCHFEAVYMGTG